MIEIDYDLRWLRCHEAASLLNVSVGTVRAWLRRGYLEGFKLGGIVRVDRNSIEKLARTYSYAQITRGARPSSRQWLPDLPYPRGTAG